MKENNIEKVALPIGLSLSALLLLCFKIFALSREGDLFSQFTDGVQVFLSDLSILALVSFLSVLGVYFSSVLLRIIVHLTGAFFLLWYCGDTIVLHLTNHRLSIHEIVKFSGELSTVWTFLSLFHLPLLAIGLFLILKRILVPRPLAKLILALSFFAFLAGEFLRPLLPEETRLHALGLRELSENMRFVREKIAPYSKEEIARYQREPIRAEVSLPEGAENVILVVLESFSASHSKKISGISNFLPRLDKLSERGTVFANFLANQRYSAGGRVGLIQGVVPIPFPNAVQSIHQSFKQFDSVVRVFKARGYQTEFLTSTPLELLRQLEWLEGIEFDSYRGEQEIARFQGTPRITMNAAADRLLYEEVIEGVRGHLQEGQKFFTMVSATNTHRPYHHPEGGENSEEGLWDYADRELERFYHALEELSFFEKGILLVTGDHHSFNPISKEERVRYGASAKARIALYAFGRGIPQGQVEKRVFQQADLFRRLSKISDPQAALSELPIFVEKWTSFSLSEAMNGGNLAYFDPKGDLRTPIPLVAYGRDIHWLKEAPANSAEIEARIHGQRAFFQDASKLVSKSCSFVFSDIGRPSSDLGVELFSFTDTTLSGDLTENSSRFLKRYLIDGVHHRYYSGVGEIQAPNRTLLFRGYLNIDEPGYYWFRLAVDEGACLALNKELVLEAMPLPGEPAKPAKRRVKEARHYLSSGKHRIEVRTYHREKDARLILLWRKPGEEVFSVLPHDRFRLARES